MFQVELEMIKKKLKPFLAAIAEELINKDNKPVVVLEVIETEYPSKYEKNQKYVVHKKSLIIKAFDCLSRTDNPLPIIFNLNKF